MFRIPIRIEIGILIMLGLINLFMTRINLAVISIGMIRHNATSSSSSSTSSFCLQEHENLTTTNSVLKSNVSFVNDYETNRKLEEDQEEDQVDWSEAQKGVALGSFYYGYFLTQTFGGRGAELYGSKIVLFTITASCGLLTLFLPIIARLSFIGFVILRFAIGLFQGPMYPVLHCLITRWIPQLERSRFLAVVCMAPCLGTVIIMPLCGSLVSSFGWQAAFYVTGCLPIAWAILWMIMAKDDPKDHPRITIEELSYIKGALADGGTDTVKIKQAVPWRKIFTSAPFWGIVMCGVGNSWGFSFFSTYLPTYLKSVLNYSTANSGILSALPFLSRYFGGILSSYLSDIGISKGYISLLAGRRIFGAISMFGPASMLLLVLFFECNAELILLFLCGGFFLNGAIIAGYYVNHTDLSPVYSGTLLGIENSFSNVPSFLAPILTGLILSHQNSANEWRIVFLISIPIYAITAMGYLCLISTTIQSWNFAYKKVQIEQNDDKVDEEDQSFSTTMSDSSDN